MYVDTYRIKYGATDGTRTHDNRDHNPGLYQLSYNRHNYGQRIGKICRLNGAPGRIRTCGHLLRREMLYPAELQALLEDFYILSLLYDIFYYIRN